MKKLIVIIILLCASVAGASQITKIINWINNKNYNKTQLENNLTWPKLEAAAESRNIDPNDIKPYWHTIVNSVHSYWRKGQMEKHRGLLESTVREYKPNANVTIFGYGPSLEDPNSMAGFYLVEIPLNLERN